jgi:hypothetical protein
MALVSDCTFNVRLRMKCTQVRLILSHELSILCTTLAEILAAALPRQSDEPADLKNGFMQKKNAAINEAHTRQWPSAVASRLQ